MIRLGIQDPELNSKMDRFNYNGIKMTNLEIIEMAALRLGCERALALLEDPDASHFDADKLIHFLKTILEQ